MPPMYEYFCQNCKHEFEVYETYEASLQPKDCECGAQATKQMGTANVRYNGEGFPTNDFKRGR